MQIFCKEFFGIKKHPLKVGDVNGLCDVNSKIYN